MLFIAMYDYHKASGRMTIHMQVFQAWYCAMYPDKLAPNKRYMADKLADLRSISRPAQKRRLLEEIAVAVANPDIVGHPMTEA